MSVTFKEMLDDVATQLGNDPGFLLAEGDARAHTRAINTWAGYAWKQYPWPDLMTLIGPVTPVDGAVNIETQLGGGDVVNAFRSKPRPGWRSAIELPFRIFGNFVQMAPSAGAVWFEVRRKFSRYTSQVYDSAETPAAGDKRYFPDDGQVKRYDGNNWIDLETPEIVADYVVARAVAQAKSELGDTEGFQRALVLAQQILDNRRDSLELQQGQGRRYGVIVPERARGV